MFAAGAGKQHPGEQQEQRHAAGDPHLRHHHGRQRHRIHHTGVTLHFLPIYQAALVTCPPHRGNTALSTHISVCLSYLSTTQG